MTEALGDRQKSTDPEQHISSRRVKNMSFGDVREWRMTVAAGHPVTRIVPSGRPRHAARSLTGVGPAIRTP
jgi:hypothetical protein